MSYTAPRWGDVARPDLGEQMAASLVAFFRYSWSMAGGWSTVSIRTPGVRDNFSLTPVTTGTGAAGTVWSAPFVRWWQEGDRAATPTLAAPVTATGVMVNGTIYPTATTTGPFAHTTNAEQGVVRFAVPIPLTSVVQVSTSVRTVGWTDDTQPWVRDLIYPSSLTETTGSTTGTTVFDPNQAVPPLVVVSPLISRESEGYGLGVAGRWQLRPVLLHIVSPDAPMVRRIADSMMALEKQEIPAFDLRASRAAGAFVPAVAYPSLLQNFPASSFFVESVQGSDVSPLLPFHRGTIRLTLRALPLT